MAGKGEEFGQMAVVKPRENMHFMRNEQAAEFVLYLRLGPDLKLSSGTVRTLEEFRRTAEKSEKGVAVATAMFETLGKIKPEFEKAISTKGGLIGKDRLESVAAEGAQDLVKMGFTKEEATYLVGKALIDMGLKEPLQEMLGMRGNDSDVINAFMTRMHALSHAKEQKEKAEGDLKSVLAEHNVTERKYEAA
ncbi:Uncharacterised protein [Candidatus Anstonella stagnisolia]|nr:Uncharacterised protein [Candidatus Anstonella stagnisolia]